MNSPPKELWERGTNGNCSTLVLEVRVCMDAAGHLWSAHSYQDPADESLAKTWSGGGVRQISFAMLTEALRREVYTCALIELTRDPEFLKKYQESSEKDQDLLSKSLGDSAQKVLTSTTSRMAQGAAQEVISMLISQSCQNPSRLNSDSTE